MINKLKKLQVNKSDNHNGHTPSQGGFTLIELLLVIALISISIGVTSDILVTLTRSYNKTTVYTEIEQQANFVGLKLEKELRSATNVDVVGSQLSFNLNGTIVYYNVATTGGYTNIFRSTGAASTSAANALIATPSITGTNFGIDAACLGTCFSVSGSNPQVVDIAIEFYQASGNENSFAGSVELRNTIVIRNTY